MMTERETPQAIHDRAAEWVARIDRSEADPETQAELEAWLAGDERRQGAYYRAQVAWTMLDRASALRAGQADDIADTDHGTWLSRRRVIWGGGAVAASLALVAAGIGLRSPPTEHIETAIGEIRRVPLHDGSLVAVNTQTQLSVSLQSQLRKVAINKGEAWFQVAHDRTRPFVVEAGDIRVRAVGTAFSVRRSAEGADVQVTEGVVEAWSVSDAGNIRRIAAGARAFVSDASGPAPAIEASSAIDRSLSWRNGQLVFDGDTLGEAAEEFNRYNSVKLVVADSGLARERMIGRFRTNEPDAFARAASQILGAKADRDGDRIVLSRN